MAFVSFGGSADVLGVVVRGNELAGSPSSHVDVDSHVSHGHVRCVAVPDLDSVRIRAGPGVDVVWPDSDQGRLLATLRSDYVDRRASPAT